jgi:hypothetical protein
VNYATERAARAAAELAQRGLPDWEVSVYNSGDWKWNLSRHSSGKKVLLFRVMPTQTGYAACHRPTMTEASGDTPPAACRALASKLNAQAARRLRQLIGDGPVRDEKGRFLQGPDGGRHEFSDLQRSQGYITARLRGHSWLYRKMRSKYRKKGTWYPQTKPDGGER